MVQIYRSHGKGVGDLSVNGFGKYYSVYLLSFQELSANSNTLSGVKSSAAKSWNATIKGICQSAITRTNSSEDHSVYKLSQWLLKKWTYK